MGRFAAYHLRPNLQRFEPSASSRHPPNALNLRALQLCSNIRGVFIIFKAFEPWATSSNREQKTIGKVVRKRG
uniref:Uncharacterized protein n=1 Tax=Ascaris lumbricoides TaxID=6252 RepID=A0A0M3I2A9_ASCLU